MRESKRKRLGAKGWEVGGTTEFLRLTPEEAAYVDLKVKLASNLREWRQRHHLSQGKLARLVRSSQSRVAKMEAAHSSVSLDLLIRTLLALGASSRKIAQMIAAPRRATAA